MSVNQSISDYEKNIWTLVMITYNLDSQYCSMVMDLRKEETTIWFNPRGANMKKIVIPKVFSDIHPNNAEALASQLHHLVAFS